MDIHKNARTTPWSRAEIVTRVLERRQPVPGVAADLGVSERTVRKWLARYQGEGEAGLQDRSCRPHRSPRTTPEPVVAQGVALRQQRWTGARIAPAVALSRATVGRLLRRQGLARRRLLAPPGPVQRDERAAGGPAARRHQEAGPHRGRGPSDHRRSPAPRPRRRLGVGPRGDR